MGAVTFSVRSFYDSSTEFVGVKSGLLLDRLDVRKLLLEKFNDNFLKKDDLNSGVRLRAEDLESMFSHIRRRIGNLPPTSLVNEQYKFLREYLLKGGDFHLVAGSTTLVLKYLHHDENRSAHEIALLIQDEKKVPYEVAFALASIGLERYDESCVLPASKEWQPTSKLSDLFQCEIKSENEHEFLDQKFLDYLAVNGNEIEDIHWRNFEKFCAEFFRREGYHVDLGPGINDGGTDLRVYNIGEAKPSKPLIMLQCKRYKRHRAVAIEAVKAFYDDVRFEGADSGLIATTSYIAAGGKKVSNTRGYNLTFAESNNVKQWAGKMWKYSKL
jgi:restriction system protein